MIATDWYDLDPKFALGEPGGCGICPPTAPGLQGDRGAPGYRGRPGVSLEFYLIWIKPILF